jgi:hypothetical protein
MDQEQEKDLRFLFSSFLAANPDSLHFEGNLLFTETSALCEELGKTLFDLQVLEQMDPPQRELRLFDEFTPVAREIVNAIRDPLGLDQPSEWTEYKGWDPA